jgi:hypothetical protein
MKTTNMLVGFAYDNAKQSDYKLVHEHEFVRATNRAANDFSIQCITCGTYYCGLCGKTLNNINMGSCK